MVKLRENDNHGFSENKLTIKKTGTTVSFPYKINKVLICKDMLIVLIYPPTKIIYNEGIFGINMEGDTVWQIKNVSSMDNPFTNITLKDEKIMAWNWDGFVYCVDPITGKILYKEFKK